MGTSLFDPHPPGFGWTGLAPMGFDYDVMTGFVLGRDTRSKKKTFWGGSDSQKKHASKSIPSFGACCLDVRTLAFCQLMGFPN